jgi:hypothetical protein
MLLGRLTVMRKVKLPDDSAVMGICCGSPSVVPNKMADAPPAFAAGLHSAVNVTAVPGVAVDGVAKAVDPPLPLNPPLRSAA